MLRPQSDMKCYMLDRCDLGSGSRQRTQGYENTTREKPTSSEGFGPLSSAGTGATNKALQLTYSSSAGCPTLLLYMNSCSALWERALLILSAALFAGTRY